MFAKLFYICSLFSFLAFQMEYIKGSRGVAGTPGYRGPDVSKNLNLQ